MTNSKETRGGLSQEDLLSGDLGLGNGLKPGGYKPTNIGDGCDSGGGSGGSMVTTMKQSSLSRCGAELGECLCVHCSGKQVRMSGLQCRLCDNYSVTSDQVFSTSCPQVSPRDLKRQQARGLGIPIQSQSPSAGMIQSIGPHTIPTSPKSALTRPGFEPKSKSFHYPNLRIQETLAHLLHGHDHPLPKETPPVKQESIFFPMKRFLLKPNQNKDFDQKLIFMIQEVEEIKMEFENCQLRLESKYAAIRILKQQMELSQKESNSLEKKIKSENKELVKAVNQLQFALGHQESTLMDSQQTWAHRFDSACCENTRLLNALEERSEELQKVLSQKMAITRERDELLALVDVQDNMKYDRTHTYPEDRYSSFSASQLAILGACICRGQRAEPCGCAYSAANMHREILKLKEELELSQHQVQDSYMMSNAYRYAFEEQLLSFRQMLKQLNELNLKTSPAPVTKRCTNTSNGGKKESLLELCSGLLKQSLRKNNNTTTAAATATAAIAAAAAEDSSSESDSSSIEQNLEPSQDLIQSKLKELNINSLKSPHLVTLLLEMLQEKSEILAYQKLASRILVNKLKDLESGIDSKDGSKPEEVQWETREDQEGPTSR